MNYPVKCKHCNQSLYGSVKYCPFCGNVFLVDVTTSEENNLDTLMSIISLLLIQGQGEYTPYIRRDIKKKGKELGITEEKSDSLLLEELKEQGFSPVTENLSDPLFTLWWSAEKRKTVEKSLRQPQVATADDGQPEKAAPKEIKPIEAEPLEAEPTEAQHIEAEPIEPEPEKTVKPPKKIPWVGIIIIVGIIVIFVGIFQTVKGKVVHSVPKINHSKSKIKKSKGKKKVRQNQLLKEAAKKEEVKVKNFEEENPGADIQKDEALQDAENKNKQRDDAERQLKVETRKKEELKAREKVALDASKTDSDKFSQRNSSNNSNDRMEDLITRCNKAVGDAEKETCLMEYLVSSDKEITQTYREILASLPNDEKTKLRNEERAWIKERDQTCKVDFKEPDRKKWMEYILKDHTRTVCVIRHTYSRVNELEAMKERYEMKFN